MVLPIMGSRIPKLGSSLKFEAARLWFGPDANESGFDGYGGCRAGLQALNASVCSASTRF
jgi:hypothetical protein